MSEASEWPGTLSEEWLPEQGSDLYGRWAAFTYKGLRCCFRWIPPGTFLMGSPFDELERESNNANETRHQVTLTRGFWLGECTVTQALWEMVMGENPSHFIGSDLPVEHVSWEDTQRFIGFLNREEESLALALPTEAQWEYACRAGTTTPFWFGDRIGSDQVNFNGNYPYGDGPKTPWLERTIKAKALPCNAWGLYQMHGNVREWCHDWYGDYSPEPVRDPLGPSDGDDRVQRGGSWCNFARICRSAYRNHRGPGNRYFFTGLRLARNQGGQVS